jgi:sugar/nucleoside kinase (ribokinase family)
MDGAVTMAISSSFLQSQRYTVRVVDQIGGGDSFAAGPIYGFLSGRDLEATRKCAMAASASSLSSAAGRVLFHKELS